MYYFKIWLEATLLFLFSDSKMVFRARAGKKINRLELSGPVGGLKERVFIASGSEVKGYTKKGKNFLSFDTNLSEPITSMWVKVLACNIL